MENEEILAYFKITELRKRVWEKELNLLTSFHNLCKEYDLTYWAIGGTLLGAIRHNGFIPWDDDIDVAMPRKDYDRFRTIAKTYHFGGDIFFQSEETDKYYVTNNVRLRDSSTTAIQQYDIDLKIKYNRGIWLSIFPFDNIPDGEKERKRHIRRVTFVQQTLYYGTHGKVFADVSLKRKIFIIYAKLVKFILGKKYLFNKQNKLSQKYNNIDTKTFGQVSTFYECGNGAIFNKEWFKSMVPHCFENTTVMIPSDYLSLLNDKFGDWHKFVIGKSAHGNVYYDTENSYKKYEKLKPKELKDLFKNYVL